MQGRETTRPEDMTYSVLGIFGVNMPLIYGEGHYKARVRLSEEITQLDQYDNRAVLTGMSDSDSSRKSGQERKRLDWINEWKAGGLDAPAGNTCWYQDSSGQFYSIQKLNGFYEQVFQDGRTGARLSVDSPHAAKMKAAYDQNAKVPKQQGSGSRNQQTVTTSARQPAAAIQAKARAGANDDESSEDEDEEEDSD